MSKAKLNKNDFKFDKKKDETLIKVPGQIDGRDFLISNLEGCEVYLMDHIAQIFVDDCKNCTIYIGPVEASVFIRDCENLKVSAACSQYRISDSTNIDSFVYAQTDPTLEKCRGLRFAPYNFAYPLQKEHFEKAKLDPTKNHWSQVFDFNENKQDPNWTILPPEEYPGPVEKTVEGLEDPVNPVEINKEYGGTLDAPIIVGSQEVGVGGQGQGQGEEGMMEFDIQTGLEQAQNTFESQQQGSATLKQEEEQQPVEERHEEPVEETHDPTQGQNYDEQHQEEQQQQHQEEVHYEEHHEEQQHQYQEQEQAQYGGGQEYEFHQEQQQAQEYVAQGYEEQQQQQQYQAGAHDFDDMFGGGGASTTMQSTPVTQSYASQQQQQAYPAYQAGGYGYGENYDPEEEERQERLRRLEYDRNVRLEEKARVEREKKQEKISKAAHDLNQWHSERLQNIEKRKKMNQENQEIQREAAKEEQFKNPWEKIVANIALKEGEYPGTKDVTRFRQSLVNKKLDAAKGLGSDLPF